MNKSEDDVLLPIFTASRRNKAELARANVD